MKRNTRKKMKKLPAPLSGHLFTYNKTNGPTCMQTYIIA